MNFDDSLNAFDMFLLRQGLVDTLDAVASQIGDLNADGETSAADAVLLQSCPLRRDVEFETRNTLPCTPPEHEADDSGAADDRKMGHLNRE